MRHIDIETAQRLLRSELSDDEKIAVLSEVASCDECAAVLAEAAENEAFIPIPWGFAESTLLSVLPPPEPEKGPQKTESLFWYTVKIVAAMCAALMLIFSGIVKYADKIDFSAINDKTSWVERQIDDSLKTLSEKRYNHYLEEYGNAD